VVDVTHDRDHGRPGPEIFVALFLDVLEVLGLKFGFLFLAGSTSRIWAPISAAKSSIMSSVSDCVAVTTSPWRKRKRMRSPADRLSFGPSSRAVLPRSMITSKSGTGAFEGV
jgi:hypothetical protein